MKSTLLVVFLCEVLLVISGCFITNCPPGGKRSENTDSKIRQCETCGPPGSNGLCYGPHICCSSEGCLMGTSETLVCLKENTLHSTPCQNPGSPCSGDDSTPINGQCAAPGVCCSSDTCMVDENCQAATKGQGMKGSMQESFPLRQHIFRNPLDRWIPRRLGLNGARTPAAGFRKPLRIMSQEPYFGDSQLLDRLQPDRMEDY